MLELSGISRQYGTVAAVADVSTTVARGEFVALVGASGSGKSTLLKTVNRLVEPDTGVVLIGGLDTAQMPLPQLRQGIGYVFQEIGLFPHMTIRENIAIGPRLAGRAMTDGEIVDALEQVELAPDVASRMPAELSGGQRQRVGVARALATRPALLLMDEPFGALDPITRDALGRRIRALHDELDMTTVMVTHDMAEALLLATRIMVMDAGRIVADDTPRALLDGSGGPVAQALVAVPRDQARRLADTAP